MLTQIFTQCFTHLRSYCPIFWQCLIRRYLALFFLATGAVVLILLTSSLEEVASFIAIGASFQKILLFVLYRIPYILQIALPIGGFIAGYALSSRMSQAGEITAMRSLGKSIVEIFTPLFAISALLASGTFLLLFDLAAKSHLATKKLEYDVRSEEPLALLQSGQFLDEHSIALELSGSLKTGSHAKNMLICTMPKGQDRLTLALFKEARAEENVFTGDTFTLFSTTARKKPDSSDANETICVENAVRKHTPTQHLHEATQKKKWKVGPDHMKMSSVMAVRSQHAKQLEIERYQGKISKNTLKRYGRFCSEPWRRISLSLAIMTLTYAGFVFGISIRRIRNPFQLGYALIPFFLFIGLYLMGKSVNEVPSIAIICFIVPHLLLPVLSNFKKDRIEQGVCRS